MKSSCRKSKIDFGQRSYISFFFFGAIRALGHCPPIMKSMAYIITLNILHFHVMTIDQEINNIYDIRNIRPMLYSISRIRHLRIYVICTGISQYLTLPFQWRNDISLLVKIWNPLHLNQTTTSSTFASEKDFSIENRQLNINACSFVQALVKDLKE